MPADSGILKEWMCRVRLLENKECFAVAGGVCGSGILEPFIPNKPFGFDFTQACARHDLHYTAPNGMSRATADSIFLDDMLAVVGDNVLGRITAYAYYSAVRVGGGAAFGGEDNISEENGLGMRSNIQGSIANGVFDHSGGQGMQLLAQHMASGSAFEAEVAAWWQRIEDLGKDVVVVSLVIESQSEG